MRAMIDQADLARYAGRFVWLQLNFDKAENSAFFAQYGAIGTPTFYIIDPHRNHPEKSIGASTGGTPMSPRYPVQ